jgi:transcription initiation factor IIF auxiliary subunit
MAISLSNRARPSKPIGGQQYYDWEVFVDESDAILDQIDHVVYFLHETFPDPIRTITDRQGKFACRTKGWGEFDIAAQVVFKDKRVEQAEYRLDLSKSWA